MALRMLLATRFSTTNAVQAMTPVYSLMLLMKLPALSISAMEQSKMRDRFRSKRTLHGGLPKKVSVAGSPSFAHCSTCTNSAWKTSMSSRADGFPAIVTRTSGQSLMLNWANGVDIATTALYGGYWGVWASPGVVAPVRG